MHSLHRPRHRIKVVPIVFLALVLLPAVTALMIPTRALADEKLPGAPAVTSPVDTGPGQTQTTPTATLPTATLPTATLPTSGSGGPLADASQPSVSPEVRTTGGGPSIGVASGDATRRFDLPAEIESLWPTPGVKLLFPNREVRVTFNTTVDSRTFTGRIVDVDGNEVNGTDGAPVLFTRAAETPTITREVIGVLAYLEPGTYQFDWSVKTTEGKTIAVSVPFTQVESVTGVGGSNHRHGDLRLPGEDYLIAVARFLLVIGAAFTFLYAPTRRWARNGAGAALGIAGMLYTAAFAIPAYDSELELAELLARLEGWAAVSILIAATSAALVRSRTELFAVTGYALVAAQATTYIPRLSYGMLHVLLLSAALAGVGYLVAAGTGLLKSQPVRQLLTAVTAALAPAISVIVVAGTLMPTRGQGEDLRSKMVAAVVVALTAAVSLLISEGLKVRKPYFHLPLLIVAAVAVAVATTAPALL